MDSDPEFIIDPSNPPAPPTYRERYLQMDVMTCYNDAGTPIHLRCHLLDITDRIRTEQELRRRTEELSLANARLRQINVDLARLKESYRDLYHHAPDFYFGLDPRGHFVAFNESMLRALGYQRDDLVGQPYTRSCHRRAGKCSSATRMCSSNPANWKRNGSSGTARSSTCGSRQRRTSMSRAGSPSRAAWRVT